MKRYLYPARLWQRLLVWLSTVFLCYVLLTAVACLVADACEEPPLPEADAIFWLPSSYFIFMLAMTCMPLIFIPTELAAYLLRGRKPLALTDYAVSLLLLPCLNAGVVYVSGEIMAGYRAWPLASNIAAAAAGVFTLVSIVIPPVSKIRNAWGRCFTALPLCWLWGISLAVLIGAIIDCNDDPGCDPIAIFPYSVFIIPLYTIGGLLPAMIPFGYIEGKAAGARA